MSEAGSDPIPTPEDAVNQRSFDIGVLSEQVRQAHQTLREQRDAYAAGQRATDQATAQREAESDRKNRRSRTGQIVTAVLAAAALAVGVVGVVSIRQADAEQTRNRVTSCGVQSEFQSAHNGLVERSISTLRNVFGDSQNPAVLVGLAEEIVRYKGELVFVRDCSPQGIAEFFAGTGGYLP